MKQPTAQPTRKMYAVIAAGIVTSIAKPLAERYAPGAVSPDMMAQLGMWVQAAVIAVAGYLTPDKAPG